MSKHILNQKGISLVEVMVAAGISAVIALGTMKINENSQRGMRNVATKAELVNYVNFKIGSALGNTDDCRDSFGISPLVLAAGAQNDTINSLVVNGITLAEVDQILPGTSSEFIVRDIILKRDTDTACTLTLDLDRNDSVGAAKKLGGRDIKQNISMACSFASTGNELLGCSSNGSSAEGRWTYIEASGNDWLENHYTNTVLGTYPGGYPYARMTIMPDASDRDWTAAPYKDGIALPSNRVIRWTSDVTSSGTGIAIVGDGTDCMEIKFEGTVPHFTTCNTTGTLLHRGLRVTGLTEITTSATIGSNLDVGNTITSGQRITAGAGLTVNGPAGTKLEANVNTDIGTLAAPKNLKVYGNANVDGQIYSNQEILTPGLLRGGSLVVQGPSELRLGAVVTGNLDVSGRINAGNTLTVTNGGAAITGNATVSGGLTSGGTLRVNNNAGAIIQGASSISGALSVTGTASVSSTIRSGGTGYFQNIFVDLDMSAQTVTERSDRRLKTNIEPLSGSLEELLGLEPVQYNWANPQRYGDRKKLGFIAQDLQETYPDLVHEDINGFLSINYTGLIAPIIDSIKEIYVGLVENREKLEKQKLEIEALKKKDREIEVLKKENKELKARLDRIEGALISNK